MRCAFSNLLPHVLMNYALHNCEIEAYVEVLTWRKYEESNHKKSDWLQEGLQYIYIYRSDSVHKSHSYVILKTF